jgi:hypothetical protein
MQEQRTIAEHVSSNFPLELFELTKIVAAATFLLVFPILGEGVCHSQVTAVQVTAVTAAAWLLTRAFRA